MILITGAKGQLGRELSALLDERNLPFIGIDREELDITDKSAVDCFFNENKPKIVYHCAAYTAVDPAEDEGKELNWLVNVDGTKNIAEAAEKLGAKVIYISTDYVFDGENQDMYKENHEVNPQNEYGKAKLAGEEVVREAVSNYYIIRTSWVFGKYGKNFVFTMKNLAENKPKLTVVDDQFGRPTWTRTLAEFMTYAIDNNIEYGTYHLSNDESCSWYEFAEEILKAEDVVVEPVNSSQFPQKAVRPKYSIMNLSKAKKTGFEIPTWKEALSKFMSSI